MTEHSITYRLDRPVDDTRDHVLGPAGAPITLVEYGSYACAHCRAANERIAQVRDQFGDRIKYVFRHRPLMGNSLARRAAELAERASTAEEFWDAHITLMTRSHTLTEEDLDAVAMTLGLSPEELGNGGTSHHRAQARVDADIDSAVRSGVMISPTFFINGRRYDGPWDESSFSDAMLGTLGHRVRIAALDFASWGPSSGILLLIATLLSLILANSAIEPAVDHFWHQPLGFSMGQASFQMSLLHWINDGLLTVFFLVVGLEIKREFTVGHLASRRSATLPVAAAIGGLIAPALIFLAIVPEGPFRAGWGVPITTDTAFAIALIAMLGRRVPVELRIFLTAAAIVDDIGAILILAVFYSGTLSYGYLAFAALVIGALALLNYARIYRVAPYVILGAVLWVCVYAGGLHATLAGVLLALFIPTRPPPNLAALMMQANTIIASEARHGEEVLRHGASLPVLRSLDAIHDRIESPADRLLRHAGARSSYLVLPLFALANGGVLLSGDVVQDHETLIVAIVVALVVGKPAGIISASALAVLTGLAEKPTQYSWRQLAGASALGGIGFTMSLFIAGQAFADVQIFAAAKIAVFAASVLSACIGVAVLWKPLHPIEETANAVIRKGS